MRPTILIDLIRKERKTKYFIVDILYFQIVHIEEEILCPIGHRFETKINGRIVFGPNNLYDWIIFY